ncbi:MAG: hypothetical protein ACREO0_15600, partial [Pseudoxanthomonas sp.]
MTAKKPLANPRLAAKVAAKKKAGIAQDTPTHISAILGRVGKLERAQRASIPEQLLKKLDALGKIVANLEQAHVDLAAYVHQELAEIRLALTESVEPQRLATCVGGSDLLEVAFGGQLLEMASAMLDMPSNATIAVTEKDVERAVACWPGAAYLQRSDLEEFARSCRIATAAGGVVELPIDKLPAQGKAPGWLLRMLYRLNPHR